VLLEKVTCLLHDSSVLLHKLPSGLILEPDRCIFVVGFASLGPSVDALE